MKHIELLNLICRHRRIINEAYKNKRVLSAPLELIEVGLFNKIGSYYYINEAYIKLIDSLLARAEYSYVIEDFEKEINKLMELKDEFRVNKNAYFEEIIFNLITNIFQGMKNRDKKVLALVEKLENDDINDLDILIKEAKTILRDVEEVMKKNEKIVDSFELLMEFSEFKELIKDVLIEIIHFNQNIDSYLKRLRDFISQTEKKRHFNQQLFKIAYMILNENSKIETFLETKRFVFKKKIAYFPDSAYINYEKAKKAIGKLKKEKKVINRAIKRDLKEVIELIDIKKLIKQIQGSEDIFKSILNYIGKLDKELLNESVRVFVYILNHFDKEVIYTKEYNEYNVRVVKWRA